MEVNDKETTHVQRMLEEQAREGVASDRLFVHNSPEFARVYSELPEIVKSKLLLIQNPYVAKFHTAALKTDVKEILFGDRLSHLADLECLTDLRLSFPKVPPAVSINSDFRSEELDFWRSAMRLEIPTRFSGYPIIEGKKVGRKLGIPTGFFTSEHFRRKRSRDRFFYDAGSVLRAGPIPVDDQPSPFSLRRKKLQGDRQCGF